MFAVPSSASRFTAGFLRVNRTAALLTMLLALPQSLAAAPVFHPPVPLAAKPYAEGVATAPVLDAAAAIDFAAFVPLASTEALRADIAALEDTGAVWSPSHAEKTLELGKALQAEGDHEAALRAFDQGLQVLRRVEGLYSAAQANVLRARIDSQLALGRRDEADALHDALLSLQRRVHAADPLTLAEAHLEWADWNVRYYLETKATPPPGGLSDAAFAALDARLGRAFAKYHEGLALLGSVNQAGLALRKVEVERRIAAVTALANEQYKRNMPNTLTKQELTSAVQSRSANHPALLRHGSTALQRAIEHSTAAADPALVAERMLELGDWYLLMSRNEEAWSTYAEAARLLQETNIAAARQQDILQSGLPVHDPVAELQALAVPFGTGERDGWLDVQFEVSRDGRAHNARILDGSTTDAELEQALLRRLDSESFRPGFSDGQLLSSTPVTLRYYFTRQ